MSKDMKAVLKTKRKVSNFMEKAMKEATATEDIHNMDTEESDLDSVIEEVILSDSSDYCPDQSDNSEREKDEPVPLELLGASALDESAVSMITSDDSYNEVGAAAPYMKLFTDGIAYRKLDCNSLLVSIEPLKQLYFAGKALIQVLKGTVDIFGYKFGVDGNKYCVFSAKGHSSLLSITAIGDQTMNRETTNLTMVGHSNVSEEELETSIGALLIMEGFENEWCEGFRHLYPDVSNLIGPSILGIGPGKTPKPSTLMDKLGFQFVKAAKNLKLLEFPLYFDEIFNDLITKYDCSRGKICPFGGQGVGKSTFVKWITNRFLSTSQVKKVLFLDLDPGQSEFTPPGMLAVHICTEPILGPNFTHLQDAVRAIYLGGLDMADIPVSYIKGVAELVEFCSNNVEFEGIPWIINTMGFSKGLGVHLACEIIKVIRPDCVIQLQIDNDARSFPFFLNKDNVSKHHTFLSSNLPSKYQSPLSDYTFLSVKSACNREDTSNSSGWGMDRKKARKLVLTSYFAEKVGNSEGFSLQSVIPLRVPLDSIAVGTISSALSYEEIISTLNGNLVALCAMSDSLFKSSEGNKKFITKAIDHPNQCFGYGLVRAYRRSSDTLYLISPLDDTEILSKVNVILAAGAIGIPVSFYVSSSSGKTNKNVQIPYVMNRNEGTSTLHTAAKKFFVPKRVTHSVLKNCLM